jgi:Leu/Phe-tRNA-protein transferase
MFGRFLQANTSVQFDIIIFLTRDGGEEKQIVNKMVEHYKGKTWQLLQAVSQNNHLHSFCKLKPIIYQHYSNKFRAAAQKTLSYKNVQTL